VFREPHPWAQMEQENVPVAIPITLVQTVTPFVLVKMEPVMMESMEMAYALLVILTFMVPVVNTLVIVLMDFVILGPLEMELVSTVMKTTPSLIKPVISVPSILVVRVSLLPSYITIQLISLILPSTPL